MKSSEILFLDKESKIRKDKINNLSDISPTLMSTSDIKTEKELFVNAVVCVPEFDEVVSHLSQHISEYGSTKDKDGNNFTIHKFL